LNGPTLTNFRLHQIAGHLPQLQYIIIILFSQWWMGACVLELPGNVTREERKLEFVGCRFIPELSKPSIKFQFVRSFFLSFHSSCLLVNHIYPEIQLN
jgi:hypothetical protein